MARLRARVERAAALHRQAVAAATVAGEAIEAYSPAIAPADQYAEQHELAARLRGAAGELMPGWLGSSLEAMPAAVPADGSSVAAYLRLGLARPLDDAHFPAIAPFLGTGHLAIDADARDPRVAGLIRSLVLRLLAATAPGSLRVRVIDGAGGGDTVGPFTGIDDLMPPGVTDHPGMRGVLAEADVWVREPRAFNEYLVLVIASLPELTDGNDLARIAHLARTGVGRQLHMIVAGWPPPPLTAETTQAPLANSTQLSLRNPHAWLGDPPGVTYAGSGVGPARLNSPVYLDPDPPAEHIRRVCAGLAEASRVPERAPWTPPQQRWTDYVASARRLDLVRRSAAKVVAEQSALVKRTRAELSALRGQLTGQQSRITELLDNGAPLPLSPLPAERAAADAALGRLAQAATARARGTPRPAGPVPTGQQHTGQIPTGQPTGAIPAGQHAGAGPTGQHPGAMPTGQVRGPMSAAPGAGGHPADRSAGAAPLGERGWHTRPEPPGGNHGRPLAPPGSPAGTPPGRHSRTPGVPARADQQPAPPVSPQPGQYPSGQYPAVQQQAGGHAPNAHTTGTFRPAGPAHTGALPAQPAPTGSPASHRGPGRPGPHQPGPHQPGIVRPWGPPVSGQPHTNQLNSGGFPVISAPPAGYRPAPVTGSPASVATPPPAETSPRLPEAALTMLGEARAALAHADAELAAVDARVNQSPRLHNAVIYAVFALVFLLAQIPMLLMLTAESNVPPVLGVPCGAVFVLASFACAWLTIGFVYRQPGGQRPRRSPLLGLVISLGAGSPSVALLLWSIGDLLNRGP